jgi:hypothetical protein
MLFLVVLVGLTVVPLSNRPFDVIQAGQPYHAGEFLCLFAGATLGQTFVSRAANLEAIDVFLGPIPVENVTVVFNLQMEGRDVRAVVVSSSSLIYREYNRFSFPRIPDSADKNFSFTLQSPNSTLSSSLCVYYVENTVSNPVVYPDGFAFMNGRQLPGDLTFRVVSETTLAESITNLYNRTSKDVAFFASYLILLVALGVLLVRVSRSAARERLFKRRASRRGERE